jgi:hypothetical protein
MATTKHKKKADRTTNKRLGKNAVLEDIKKWRNTGGQKLKNWDEVKAIRAMRGPI